MSMLYIWDLYFFDSIAAEETRWYELENKTS